MKCKVNIGRETFDGEFMGIFQFSEVMPPSLMVTGHTGGVVAYPVAVVKVGRFLKQVRATSVHFEEEEPNDYIDSMEEFQKSMDRKSKTVSDTINEFKKLMETNNGVKFDKSNFKYDIAGDKDSMMKHFKQLGEYK